MGNLARAIGDVRVTRVVEHEMPLALTGLLPEATAAAVERHRRWLAPWFPNADGTVTRSIHGLVVESAGRRILVDSCVVRALDGFEFRVRA